VDIWLVRHAETEWSRSGRHTGVTDVPLTPLGGEQARRLRSLLAGHAFARVLTSPRTRARETARLAGHPDALPCDLLVEYDYGRYEGLTTEQIRRERPGWELFRDGAEGGERPEEIAARMDRLLALLEPGTGAATGGDVLLFGHGHATRALAARYLGLPVGVAGRLCLDAASLSILGHEHDHPALRLWNRTA
jgi:probable phosphoglycerate mutase